MFDVGFWELLVIAVVLLLVLGPERLPEVAKQAAFWVRKVRTGMHRLRSEMKSELDGTPFADLQKAKAEVSNFKNDIQQFGRDLADSANETVSMTKSDAAESIDLPEASPLKPRASQKRTLKKKTTKKKVSKKTVAKKKAVGRKTAKKQGKKKIAKSPVTKT
jgi:sec-independent protein translocase protein TatB